MLVLESPTKKVSESQLSYTNSIEVVN